jgi:hypothetical protein
VLNDKANYVAKQRSRLIRDSDADLDEDYRHYLDLIDQLAATRRRLREKRRNTIWARL